MHLGMNTCKVQNQSSDLQAVQVGQPKLWGVGGLLKLRGATVPKQDETTPNEQSFRSTDQLLKPSPLGPQLSLYSEAYRKIGHFCIDEVDLP